VRIPFLSRVLPPGQKQTPAMDRSLLPLAAENVLLVGARPAPGGRGIILHLREVGGKAVELLASQLAPASAPGKPRRVNVLGEPVGDGDDRIVLQPYEVVFVQAPTAD